MKVLPLPALTDNYIWMILDDHAHAWVVDPGEAAPVLKALRVYQCSLQGILITHHHGDHTSGVAALIQHTQAALYGPPGLPFPTLHPVSEGKPLVLGEFLPVFSSGEIPGHTLIMWHIIHRGIYFAVIRYLQLDAGVSLKGR